jgi:hypothetical protein
MAFTLDGEEGENEAGRFNGDVTLMLLNLCCTGVRLGANLVLTGNDFDEAGISSSLMSTKHIQHQTGTY